MTHYVDAIHNPSYSGVLLPAKDSIDRWSSLSNLSRFLLESNTLHDHMERTVHSAVEILNLDFSKVLLLESNGHYYCHMAYYKDTTIAKCHVDNSVPLLAERVFQKVAVTQPALIPYYLDEEYSPEECMACSGVPFGSVWLVPLAAGSQSLGFLLLGKNDSTMGYQNLIESSHLVDLIAGQLSNAILRGRLNDRLSGTTLEIVQALTKALEARDSNSSLHSQRMANLSAQLANLMGCGEKEALDIYWAALLHDIGKIGVEDSILHKPGPLTADEWVEMKKHPQIGAQIIQGMTGLDSIAPLILMHHERMDGSGYPNGLKGDQIPLGARIIAVVDSFSAMVEGRNYKQKLSHSEAIKELIQAKLILFDAEVVDKFIGMISEENNNP